MQNYYSSDPNQFFNYRAPTSVGQGGMVAPFNFPSLDPRVQIGQSIANVGDTFGIPRIGIADFIAGQPVGKSKGVAYADNGPAMINLGSSAPQVNGVYQAPAQPQPQQDTTAYDLVKKEMTEGKRTWDDNLLAQLAPKADPEQQRQEEARKQQELQNQISSVFDPQFSSLSQTEANLQGQLDPALAGLTRQKQNLLAGVDVQERAGNEQVKYQQGILDQSKQSAWEEAMNTYKALTQNANAKFGKSSSAGGAVSELIGRQFAQNTGRNDQTYTNNIGQLMLKQKNFNDQLAQARLNINDEVFKEENAIRQDLKDKLLQISMQKNTLESQKAQAKLDLLKESIARSNQLKDLKLQAEVNLDLFKQQTDYALKAEYARLNTTQYNPFTTEKSSINQSNKVDTINPNTMTGQLLASQQYDPMSDQLINPFQA